VEAADRRVGADFGSTERQPLVFLEIHQTDHVTLGFAGRFVGKILKIHHKKAHLVMRSYVGIDTLIPVLTG
jgi:hypothetical protein